MNRNITQYKLARISLFLVLSLLQGCYSIPGNEINESELLPRTKIATPTYVEFRSSDSETYDGKKLRENIERSLVQYGFTLDANAESLSPCMVLISYERKSGSNFITSFGEALSVLTLFILPSYMSDDHIITVQIKDRKANTLLKQYSVRETAGWGTSIFMINIKPGSRYWPTKADDEALRKLRKATPSILTNDRFLKECYAYS